MFNKACTVHMNIDRNRETIIKGILILPVRITFGKDRIGVIVLVNLIIGD